MTAMLCTMQYMQQDRFIGFQCYGNYYLLLLLTLTAHNNGKSVSK
jgi:hypothetical protein